MTGPSCTSRSPDDGYRGEARRPDGTYGVPRRYSIKSILVVTAAFAGVFGLLASVGAEPIAVVVIFGFIVFVGMAQLWLFRGRKPWASSLVAGASVGVVLGMLGWLGQANPLNPTLAFYFFFLTLVGMMLGYIAGVLTAAVFMLLSIVEERARSDSSQRNTKDHER